MATRILAENGRESFIDPIKHKNIYFRPQTLVISQKKKSSLGVGFRFFYFCPKTLVIPKKKKRKKKSALGIGFRFFYFRPQTLVIPKLFLNFWTCWRPNQITRRLIFRVATQWFRNTVMEVSPCALSTRLELCKVVQRAT